MPRKSRSTAFENEAAERLSKSLVPNLHADSIWNAAAISFLNPAMSLKKSFEAAGAIDELRKRATKPRRKR